MKSTFSIARWQVDGFSAAAVGPAILEKPLMICGRPSSLMLAQCAEDAAHLMDIDGVQWEGQGEVGQAEVFTSSGVVSDAQTKSLRKYHQRATLMVADAVDPTRLISWCILPAISLETHSSAGQRMSTAERSMPCRNAEFLAKEAPGERRSAVSWPD